MRRQALPLAVTATAIAHAGGQGTAPLWNAVSRGDSNLRRNPLDWCDLPCWIGEAPGVDAVELPETLQRWDCRVHRLSWLALNDTAFRAAVAAAIARYGVQRVGIVMGTSTSGIRSTEVAYATRRQTGAWPAGFGYRQMHSSESVGRFTAAVLGVRGPMVVITTACSSSAKVFLTAQRWIEAGWIDAAVVGGADSLCLSTLHGFDSLQLLSADACRPFDAARSGISIGEAAGFALIERAEASIMFLGGGESSDAWHMSTPHPEGLGAQDAMRKGLQATGVAPEQIGYVNAHGTGTIANDQAEAAAVNAVFGTRAVPISSTKGATGHALGAAGIVEAIVTCEALVHQRLPVCANAITPDPALGLEVVTTPQEGSFRFAMTNNFGFGGSNCSLIFARTG